MALVRFVSTQLESLQGTNLEEGSIYITQDTQDIWVDLNNERTNVTDRLKNCPTGSLYLRDGGDNTSPASLFGGTWERLDSGHFLVTADENHSGTFEFRTNGLAAGQTERAARYVSIWKRTA